MQSFRVAVEIYNVLLMRLCFNLFYFIVTSKRFAFILISCRFGLLNDETLPSISVKTHTTSPKNIFERFFSIYYLFPIEYGFEFGITHHSSYTIPNVI